MDSSGNEASQRYLAGNPAPTQLRMLPSKADEAADATADEFMTPRSHAGSEPTPMSDPGDATTVTMDSDDDPDDDADLYSITCNYTATPPTNLYEQMESELHRDEEPSLSYLH